QGAKEIVYIAQDTTRFGDDIPPHRSLLADLIARTCEMPKVEWVRALYCYPSRVNEQLLETIAMQKKACKYLDLPLQHIDAALLQAMNRTGTPEQIRRLIARVRQLGFTLRTTFIVGFPGETEDAFERLMDFVEETRFERMGAFAYSPEEDTKAIEMPNQVPEEVKAERLDRLMRLQQRISLGQNENALEAFARCW
ncbi:MAG: radical SAM protein, partial [Clostridia bacterium]